MRFRGATLIPASGYDVAWTQDNGEYFHAYTAEDIAQEALAKAYPPGVDPTNQYPWLSNCSILSIPVVPLTTQPLLIADNYRNLLVIQNNSSATSPDTTPNLFVSVNGPVQFVTRSGTSFAFNAITLQAGEGVVFDTRVPTNAIYVNWGTYTNGGGTAYVSGVLMFGRTPNSPPAPPALPVGSLMPVNHRLVDEGNATVNGSLP